MRILCWTRSGASAISEHYRFQPCCLLTEGVLEPHPEPNHTACSCPFTRQAREQTSPAVQAYVQTLHDEMRRLRHEMHQLHERVESLEARLKHNSTCCEG